MRSHTYLSDAPAENDEERKHEEGNLDTAPDGHCEREVELVAHTDGDGCNVLGTAKVSNLNIIWHIIWVTHAFPYEKVSKVRAVATGRTTRGNKMSATNSSVTRVVEMRPNTSSISLLGEKRRHTVDTVDEELGSQASKD